jgi:hypothetical protein
MLNLTGTLGRSRSRWSKIAGFHSLHYKNPAPIAGFPTERHPLLLNFLIVSGSKSAHKAQASEDVDQGPPQRNLLGGFAFSISSRLRLWETHMAGTRGRPPKTQSFEFCQDLWTRIEYLRVRLARPNGRPASISCVATALSKNGGVAEIVGGDQKFLAREVALLPNARLAHATVESTEGRIVVPVFAMYVTSNTTRIRNLYYEASRWTADPEIEFAWRNMVYDLCGQPRKVRDSTIPLRHIDNA